MEGGREGGEVRVTEMPGYLVLLAVTLAGIFYFFLLLLLSAAPNLEGMKYFLHKQPKATQAR